MNNQEAFEAAVAGNWIAESFTRPDVSDGIGKFYLTGTSKGYSTFGDALSDGQVVFFAAFDDDCNREAGYGVFNGDDQSITPIETTASLANGVYIDGDVAPISFPNGGTITGTFNAVAFNAIWDHIWNKENPHEVVADQVEQDNDNNLGDNVQDALDNLSGIIAEWDEAIKATAQNYVTDLPPARPEVGDMWTDVGVTGEQYVWEGKYWVSVTGGGLGIDLSDPDNLPPSVVLDDVGEELELYDKPLSRVIDGLNGKGKWVLSPTGGDSGGDDNIEANQGDVSVKSVKIASHFETGDWGQDVFDQKGGMLLDSIHEGDHTSGCLKVFDRTYWSLNNNYFQFAYDLDEEDGNTANVYGDGVWAVWEPHSVLDAGFNVRIWAGRAAGKRAGIGAPFGRCEFYEGHFNQVTADSYLDQEGNAMMSISDVIDGFSAVQQAVSDEVTVEGLRDAISNAVGGFIERLEARQAEHSERVRKSAEEYAKLLEEGKKNV